MPAARMRLAMLSIMPSCGPGARWRLSPTCTQGDLERSGPGCRESIAGRLGDPRMGRGFLFLRLAGDCLPEAGKTG